jgi:hypothetical protein
MKKFIMALFLVGFGCAFITQNASAATINYNRIIDDNVFDKSNSMSASQIDSFLNSFPKSCLSTKNGFSSPDVTGYNATDGFKYGGKVSAGTVIAHASQAYGLNPQVLLATLQKEQSLVTGEAGCYNEPNPAWPSSGSPANGKTFTCSIGGTNTTCTYACTHGGGCINVALGYGCPYYCKASYEGFSKQIVNAAWKLTFDRHRSEGQNNWYINKTGWNNSDDLQWCYSGKQVAGGPYYLCPDQNSHADDPYIKHAGKYNICNSDGSGCRVVIIQNGATAALYNYTPFLTGQNSFFNNFTKWFGSALDSVTVTSPLTITPSTSEGAYTGVPITLSFSMYNSTSSTQNVQVAIAARDSSGTNMDFPLKTISIGASRSVTYSVTKTFAKEDNYTFWITSFHNNTYDDNYPTSSNVFNVRKITPFIQAMPTITQQPTASVQLRQNKAANLSFKVSNTSSKPVNLGLIGLAVRDPNNGNRDLPFDTVSALAPGTTYTYSKSFIPTMAGNYKIFVSDTVDGGKTWNQGTFPANGTGVSHSITLNALPNPTITQAPTLSIGTPRVGQNVTGTFTIHNYGDSAMDIGGVALAIRGPNGLNQDMSLKPVTIQPGQDYTYTDSRAFPVAGSYTAWITDLKDNKWNDTTYPALDSGSVQRKVTFTVQPNPTITQTPTLSISTPRVGQNVTGTFVVHNYGDTAVNIGGVALAIRGPNKLNQDTTLKNVTIQPGQSYTYSDNRTFPTAGTYTAWVTNYRNGKWDDTTYPAVESSSIHRKISFTVLPSPTITKGPTLSIASPRVGQSVTGTFTIHNYGDTAVDPGKLALAIRGPKGLNRDMSLKSAPIPSGQDFAYSDSQTFSVPGTYTAWITDYRNGKWDDTTYPAVDTGSIQRKITFTVTP